jgi:hypothetical protein
MGGADPEAPGGEGVVAIGPAGQGLLGRFATAGDIGQPALHLVAGAAGPGSCGLRLGQRPAQAAAGITGELPAGLRVLAREALVQLGGLRLALERPQPGAGLTLHVEGAVEVLPGAVELELGAAPALAVLAQPRRLLDQQPPVARLGGDHRLHSALRDHRVHLLAQAGVGQHLEHVDQPAPGAVQPVLALAGPLQPAAYGDLGELQRRAAGGAVSVRVGVDHQLDLRRAPRLLAGSAAEDHVLHGLAAHGQGGLLPQRP